MRARVGQRDRGLGAIIDLRNVPELAIEAVEAAMQRIRSVVDGKLHRLAVQRKLSVGDAIGVAADGGAEKLSLGEIAGECVMAEHDVVVAALGVRRDQGLQGCTMGDDARLEPALAAQHDAVHLAAVRQRSKDVPFCFRSSHDQSTNGSTIVRLPSRKASATRRSGAKSTSLAPVAASVTKRRYSSRYSSSGASATVLPSIAMILPPRDSVIRPWSISTRISQLCGPVWRKSNSAATGRPSMSVSVSFAAIGAWQLAGKASSAAVTNTGFGRILVRIDSALMPGSNTPSPPGSQIQACPGCQTRTSSFQLILTEVIRRAASHARAGSTAGAWRECQVANSVRFASLAIAISGSSSATPAPGGFSSMTCLPAVSAAIAWARRT